MTTSEIAHKLFQDENANWSYNGAYALANYLQELEDDLGESIEFDRVAIRCDFSQYESLQEWAHDYFGGEAKALAEFSWGESYVGNMDESDSESFDETLQEYIQDHGQLIEFNGGIIVSSF